MLQENWEPWKQRKGKDRVKIDVKGIPCDFYIDTLAFLGLVLTYAKSIAKNPLKKDESVKLRSAFMPRTDFHTLYKQVESQLPGDLWNIIDTLSCYKKSKDPNKDPGLPV